MMGIGYLPPLILSVRWTEVANAASQGFLIFLTMEVSLITHSFCKRFLCMR
jgi:hypothetical protein